MKLEGNGVRLRIYIGEDDRWEGGALYDALVERARAAGLAGATVVRGIEGFGVHSRVHGRVPGGGFGARSSPVVQDLPVIVEIVDQRERIDAFLPVLDEMVAEGLVTLEPVEVIRFRTRESDEPTH